MSKEDLADRHERCRNRIFKSSETGEAIPDNCSHHGPACELYQFKLHLNSSASLDSPCGIDRCKNEGLALGLKHDISASVLASWISDCATLRQHIFDSHASSLPGRSMLHSDTLEVYGFETEKSHRVMLHDVIKSVQDVQDAVYALP